VAYARFGSRLARGVEEITDDVSRLDHGGFWAVVATFEGEVTCVRFAEVINTEVINTEVINTEVINTEPTGRI